VPAPARCAAIDGRSSPCAMHTMEPAPPLQRLKLDRLPIGLN
jgi:hypothetical protein